MARSLVHAIEKLCLRYCLLDSQLLKSCVLDTAFWTHGSALAVSSCGCSGTSSQNLRGAQNRTAAMTVQSDAKEGQIG